MKLKTSFFNPTLYKKDITRFAPLWILYTVTILLIMLSTVGEIRYGTLAELERYRADAVGETLPWLSILNLFFGMLAAQLLFGELFNSRLCNALHAMPVTREARFVSHLAAGLTFSLVPNLLVSLLMLSNLGGWWYVAFVWLLAMTLQYLCFFGIAVLSMHCTGNRFAAALVYAILNFGSMAAYWFASVIYVPLMRGVVLSEEMFCDFAPVVRLIRYGDFFSVDAVEHVCRFGWGEDWLALSVYAAVGVVAMIGALLIYRRRALECAGDFMAVKLLRPVFLVIYTLCAGAFLAVFGSIFGTETYLVFLIVGLVVGFFTGKMLLERMVRVFKLKSFLQLGVLLVLMWLSLVAVQQDWFGIVRYVPPAERVKEAKIVIYNYGSSSVKVSDKPELEILETAHKLILQQEGCKHDDQRYCEIAYTMKDGSTVKREYSICGTDGAIEELEKLFRSPQAIFGYKGSWEEYAGSVTEIEVRGLARQDYLDAQDWEAVLNCLYQDCEKGMTGVQGGDMSRYEVIVRTPEKVTHLVLRNNSKTYEWLQSYEKENALRYVEQITAITLDKEPIDAQHYEELVIALYEDAGEYGLGWAMFEDMKWDAAYHLVITTNGDTEEILPIGEYAENTYKWIKNYLYGME